MKKYSGTLLLALTAMLPIHAFALDSAETQSLSTASGRSSRSEQVGFDFHIGPNISNISNVNSSDVAGLNVSSKLGLSVGVGIDLPMGDIFSFNPEFNYVQKGLSLSSPLVTTDGSTVGSVDGSVNLDYLEIPLLLKAQIPDLSTNVRPSIALGPEVGYAVNKSVSATATTNDGRSASSSQGIDSGLKSFEYGIVFGTGLEFPIEQQYSMLLNFRYELGLSNITSDGSSTNKNRTMAMTLGFKL